MPSYSYFVNQLKSYRQTLFVLIQQILGLWHEYNFNSGCYGNRTSRLPAHFCLFLQKVNVYDDVAFDSLPCFFTKLCMSKVQFVCGEHMTSYQCVTSFEGKAAILFCGYA